MFAIEALGCRARNGLRIQCCATSNSSRSFAEFQGLTVLDFSSLSRVDLAIDGADEIDPLFQAIKGAGGAMLREKIVATSAGLMIAIVDDSKAVETLGVAPVPVEVLPFASSFVMRELIELGASVAVRKRRGEHYLTEQANIVLDCDFGLLSRPELLGEELSRIPGVLAHGLFISEIDIVMVGSGARVERLERQRSP